MSIKNCHLQTWTEEQEAPRQSPCPEGAEVIQGDGGVIGSTIKGLDW